jgi:hypothetical protein
MRLSHISVERLAFSETFVLQALLLLRSANFVGVAVAGLVLV